MSKSFFIAVVAAASLGLSGCRIATPIPEGQQRVNLALAGQNSGQCTVLGSGIEVFKGRMLGADEFEVTGNLANSELSCTLPDGTVKSITGYTRALRPGATYARLILSPIRPDTEIIDYLGVTTIGSSQYEISGSFPVRR